MKYRLVHPGIKVLDFRLLLKHQQDGHLRLVQLDVLGAMFLLQNTPWLALQIRRAPWSFSS